MCLCKFAFTSNSAPERNGCIVHRFDHRKGLHAHTLGAQAVSAALKALFNGAACARDLRARLGRDIDQPFQRLAVGQEIVHQQEIVAGLL